MTGRSVFLQTQEVNNLRFDTEVMDNNLLTFNLKLTSIDILINAVDKDTSGRGDHQRRCDTPGKLTKPMWDWSYPFVFLHIL